MAWEWLQGFLGRAVDFILWITMIFACYQLIPGAPLPSQSLSVFMFILQFVALDIGGMGLRQLAQRHDVPQGSFTYKIAYACIGVTFVTLIFAGIQHATPLPKDFTTWVEVILVIFRSGLTVLYGQAIRALKFVEQAEDDRVKKLEEEVSNLKTQLDTEQKQVSSLQGQLDSERQKVSSVQGELDRQVSTVVSNGQAKVSSVQLELDKIVAEVSSLRVQLDGKNQQITSLQETLSSGMKLHENSTQQIVSSVQKQLDKALGEVGSLQEQVSSGQKEVSSLRAQLSSEQGKVSSLLEQLNRQKVSSVQPQGVQLDTPKVSSGQAKVSSVQSELDRSENAIADQIRELLINEPGLSARAIAARIGCSPTTASTWKKSIEQELSIVPRLHVVNE